VDLQTSLYVFLSPLFPHQYGERVFFFSSLLVLPPPKADLCSRQRLSVCLSVCLVVCLFVCLSVNTITQNVLSYLSQNIIGLWSTERGRIV